MAEAVPAPWMQSMAMTGLGLLIVLIVAYMFALHKKVRQMWIFGVVSSVSLVVFGGAILGLQHFYTSHWGAVVADAPVQLRSSPDDNAESSKTLGSGKPVLVLGQTNGPWLKILDADGGDGWIRSLDVRVIAL